MKKKLFVPFVLLFVVLLMATACSESKYEVIKKAYYNVDSAIKMVKLVEVKRFDTVLDRLEETYEILDNGYKVTTKTHTLNEIGSDTEYSDSVSVSQVNASVVVFGNLLEESDYTDIKYKEEDKNLEFTASVAASSIGKLDVKASDVKSNISVKIQVVADKFDHMLLSYVSSNDNAVSITFQYNY